MRRRLLFIFAAGFVVALVMALTIPLWLGWATRTAGRSYGVTFGSYERIGYGRFAFRDVEVRRANVRVSATRVEAPTPLIWGWRHWVDGENPISVDRWEVEVAKPATPPPSPGASRPSGWVPLRMLLNKIAHHLDRWLPQATVGAGRVKFPAGEISLASATWRERTLTANSLSYRDLAANATAAFSGTDDSFRVEAKSLDGSMALALASRGPKVDGSGNWIGQPATLAATFAETGWLPTEAILNAEQWTVPGERLKLERAYAAVRGTARIELRGKAFSAEISAKSDAVKDSKAPPLAVDLRGRGDAQAFTIDSLHADIPGVKARLDAPVTIERTGRLHGNGASLALQIDLAGQPWFQARGAVVGEARVLSGGDGPPIVEFDLKGAEVAAREVSLAEVSARGRLAWPRLEVDVATLIGGEGERLETRGGYDFRQKELFESTMEGSVRRRSFARWLPMQPDFDVVRISARARGAFQELEHSGSLQTDRVVFNGMNPLAVSLKWQGRGLGAERFDAEISASASKVVVSGSASREYVKFGALEITLAEGAQLAASAPATLYLRPSLRLEPLRLAGPKGNLSLAFTAGQTGKVEAAAANISSRWFSDFMPPRGPVWQLSLLALMGSWDRGPMNFSLTAGAALDIGEGRMASINAAARGDKEGVRIDALRAVESDTTVVNATGRVPVTFTPWGSRLMTIHEEGALTLDATASPHAAFWQKLAAVTGVELMDPDVVAKVRGTWLRPEGGVSFKVARLAVDAKKFPKPLPAIEAIDVQVKGDRSGVTLETFALKVEGQSVRASGRLPVPEGQWSSLFREPLAMARRGADLEVEVPAAEVAVFARFLPQVLAPQGRVEARVAYRNGGMTGRVKLSGAATRPLGPLGVLQEVAADLEMEGRTLLLRGVTARSGGQPVTLAGSVELPEPGSADVAVVPRFDLTLKGENLPFVRQTGLLVRGDVDLKLQTPDNNPTRISGTVRLRDSLFLSDVRSFLPKGGGASAARRPPYFAVETAPVNAWRLAVEVVGDHFMRLRTPVFTGVASAHFRLSGTLGDPRAIGEVIVDEGAVKMPFASFQVRQAAVRLTEADPFEPAIYLRGTGRRLGYDLAIEIDGKATAPNVTFTSSPALDSEQLLLMVMTGAAPRNEIAVTGSQRATQLGAFFGQSLWNSFTGDTGGEDRLSIISGEKVSRGGDETLEVEYKLSDRWTATFERNEFDDLVGGVKWRAFRGAAKKPDDKKPEATKSAQPTTNDARK